MNAFFSRAPGAAAGPAPRPACSQRRHTPRALASACALALPLATGCGSRSGLALPDGDATAAARDAIATDTSVVPGVDAAVVAPDVQLPDVVTTPCVWTPLQPLAITQPDRDRSPTTVRVANDRLWVGYQSSNPDPPGNQGHFVRLVSARGVPVAAPVEVIPSPPQLTTYQSLSIWPDVALDRYGGMAWDESAGCRIAPLGENGDHRGMLLGVGSEPCAALGPTATGWSFLAEPATHAMTRLVSVDTSGVRVAERVLVDTATRSAATRVVLADRTFVLVSASAGAGNPVALRHFDEAGAPLAPPSVLAPASAGTTIDRVSAWDEGTTLLVVWTEVTRGGRRALARLARFDHDARMLTAPVPVVESMQGIYSISVARRGDAVMVAYNPFLNDNPGALLAQLFRADTLAASEMVRIDAQRFPHGIFARPTSAGFVVSYGALGQGLTQVWTALVACSQP